MAIHSTAIVHKGAQIDPSAEVGPYCIVGPQVTIGPQTRLMAHVVVENDTTLGARNTIYPFASLGAAPQDLKFKGERARLVLGDDNIIRESVTLNIGTEGGHMETRVGSRCLLMAYVHVAHDCRVGSGVIMANSVGLAGHVTIDDHVIIGGLAGIHQFCRIGRHAFVAGGAMVTQDVPPFCIAQGDRARLAGLNVIGLRRAGWSRDKVHSLHHAFKRLFFSPDLARQQALEITEAEWAGHIPEVRELCSFVRQAKRGVCSGRLHNGAEAGTDATSAGGM